MTYQHKHMPNPTKEEIAFIKRLFASNVHINDVHRATGRSFHFLVKYRDDK